MRNAGERIPTAHHFIRENTHDTDTKRNTFENANANAHEDDVCDDVMCILPRNTNKQILLMLRIMRIRAPTYRRRTNENRETPVGGANTPRGRRQKYEEQATAYHHHNMQLMILERLLMQTMFTMMLCAYQGTR